MTIRPKQHARLGEFYLEEAVLDVLLEAKYKQECLRGTEISKRAGIYSDAGNGTFKNSIGSGILAKLCKEGRVQRCNEERKWELTEQEFNSRRDGQNQ